MDNFVIISLEEYNNLNEQVRTLYDDYKELCSVIEDLREEKEQKVIIREIVKEYDSDEELVSVKKTTKVKGFESVAAEVYDDYKERIEDVAKKVDELKEDYEKLLDEKEELSDTCLELQLEVARLKNRTLWQRIKNV